MVHSVSGWTRGVQVTLWDPLRTRAIPERLKYIQDRRRGQFTTRRYTNPRFVYLYLYLNVRFIRTPVTWLMAYSPVEHRPHRLQITCLHPAQSRAAAPSSSRWWSEICCPRTRLSSDLLSRVLCTAALFLCAHCRACFTMLSSLFLNICPSHSQLFFFVSEYVHRPVKAWRNKSSHDDSPAVGG